MDNTMRDAIAWQNRVIGEIVNVLYEKQIDNIAAAYAYLKGLDDETERTVKLSALVADAPFFIGICNHIAILLVTGDI